jgi:hypothetical protein
LVPYLVGGPDERAGIVQLDLGPHLPFPEGPQVRFLTNTGRRINSIDTMEKCFVAEPAPGSDIFLIFCSVADPDPDPPDPRVFGPPGFGSGSTSQRYGSVYHHAKIVRKTLIPTIL